MYTIMMNDFAKVKPDSTNTILIRDPNGDVGLGFYDCTLGLWFGEDFFDETEMSFDGWGWIYKSDIRLVTE